MLAAVSSEMGTEGALSGQFYRQPKPRAPQYRLYIDESGDHGYNKLESPFHRHLSLVGVWFACDATYEAFADGLVRIKRDIFHLSPDDHLIFHRSEIKGRKGRFGILNDPEVDARFCAALLKLVEESAFVLVMAIIDKERHQRQYSTPAPPYHYTLTALIERYAFWLSERGKMGDAMIEGRGKTEDRALNEAYRYVATMGTRYLKDATAQRVLTSRELKFKSKDADIAGLQLSDLLAQPLKCQALVERGVDNPRGGFGRELAAIARTKYRDCHKGVVSGRGRVWL